MAESGAPETPDAGVPKAPVRKFVPVQTQRPLNGRLDRDPPGALVRRTGLTDLNTDSAMAMDQAIRKNGIDPAQAAVTYGVDEPNRLVAVYPVLTAAPKAEPLWRGDDGNRVRIHLGGAFKDFPKIRPTSNRWCTVVTDWDEEHGEFLVIALGSSLQRRTVKRKKETRSPRPSRATPGA